MNILITGATGFIGGRLANALIENNHHIVATGRSDLPQNNLDSRVKYIKGDLEDLSHCQEVTKGIDILIHCAGKAGTWGSYESFFSANVTATTNLLSSAQENGVQRFINISSPSIYFNYHDQFDLKEDYLPRKFSNHYAKTKFLAEEEVSKAHSQNFLTVSLRPRLVIGAGDNNVLPRMVQMQREGKLKQVGEGNNHITVTSIGNLIHAVELTLEAPAAKMGTTYNIGNPDPVNFWRFIDRLLEKMGESRVQIKVPYRPVYLLAQFNQMMATLLSSKEGPALNPISVAILAKSMTLDLSHAIHDLGYDPKDTTEDALNEFTQWWQMKTKGKSFV